MALQFSSPQIHMASTRIFPSKCNGGREFVMMDFSFTPFSLSNSTCPTSKVFPQLKKDHVTCLINLSCMIGLSRHSQVLLSLRTLCACLYNNINIYEVC